MAADPYPNMRCAICGAEFLIADQEARISAEQARSIGRHEGDAICHACWNDDILMRFDGSPYLQRGHC